MIRLIFIFIFLGIIFSGHAQESTASKNVSTFTIEAPQLKTSKKIWIYLPENYSSAIQKKYPVLYMHDAQNLFDAKTSYAGEWNVDEKLDSLKAQVIVVGIEHGNDKRIDELTPFKNEKYGGGNADNYLEFIVKTLKPYIDKEYRTRPNTKNTQIMGSSLGGLVSYYALLKYPKVFGKAGVFSPSFWFSNDIYTLTEKAPKIKTKIYFLCGDSEDENMVKDMTKMERLLDKNRCYCLHLTQSKIVKGGQHNEKLWRDNFVTAFLWLN
ncbi:alpha/beta hydrolase [Flavobacterium poyangense]|uniref:alpha/beta hydrolase n=1 Tax=Flavobacterium poyangense TaxID=2204302 RepID=UPI001423423A|nr:alpha/beta hydrolase-fold protein [Flavobacterium sp. JXAS1]